MNGIRVTQAQLDDALACLARMPQHPWERITGLERTIGAGHKGFRIVFRCMSCGSEKEMTCDKYGEVLYVKYHYSDAFKLVQRPDFAKDDVHSRVAQTRAMYIRLDGRAIRAVS